MKHTLELYIYVETNDDINISLTPLFGTFDTNVICLSNEKYTPNKGDKLYFLDNVNIPRIKLKDLNINQGVKTVRNIQDATHIFANNSSIHEIIDSNWYYSISTDNFKKLFELIKDKLDKKHIESINTALEFYDNDVIIMSYPSVNEIRTEDVFKDVRSKLPQVITELTSSDKFTIIKRQYNELYDYIKDKTILDEQSLIAILNGSDSVTIDKVMFEQLSEMFKSSDNDNHILAMEIMANCNYLESLLYLELLFKEHSYEMSNCHTKNHVNFKSLISYLGKSKNYLNTSLDDVVRSLKNKNVLSVDKLNVILKKYSCEIENNGDTIYFKVKSVTISEELAEILNTNYEFEHLANYKLPESEEIETKTEEEIVHELYGVDNDNIETTLSIKAQNEIKEEVPVEENIESESNPILIQENNDTDDFEWF